MQNNNVNVVADDMNNVIRQSQNNSDYGFIRLEQQRTVFTNTGWVKAMPMSTLLHGTMDSLASLNLNVDSELPGKIIVRESLEPFSKNDPDRDLKKAGDTGIICAVQGQPIYRKTFFVADVTAQDVLVAHDNGDAIKEANGTTNKTVKATATPAEAFGLQDSDEIEADNTQEDGTPPLDEVEEVVEETVESFEL